MKIMLLEEMEDLTYADTKVQSVLEQSIRVYGQLQLVVIDSSKKILSGHRIVRAMKFLGHDEVACVETKSKSKVLRILLNETRFDSKDIAIADIIAESKLSKHDLYHSMPFKTYQVDAFMMIQEWDWSQYETEKDKNQASLF